MTAVAEIPHLSAKWDQKLYARSTDETAGFDAGETTGAMAALAAPWAAAKPYDRTKGKGGDRRGSDLREVDAAIDG